MTGISIPRKHYTQPQGRVKIAPEWAGRSIASCLSPMSGVMYDAVSGRVFVTPPAVSSVASQIGVVNRYSGKVSPLGWTPMNASSGVDLTLIALANPTNVRASLVSQRSGLNANQIEIRLASDAVGKELADSVAFRASSDSGAIQFATSDVTLDGSWHLFAGVCESGVQRVYADGAAGAPVTRTSPASPSNTFTLAGLPDSTAIQYSRDIGLVAVFQSALSADEIAELSINPWQLFRADPIRIYSLPTGAISINSITASNITQTGARITLGLTR